MNRIKVWPHMTIVAIVVALVAGLAVAFWMKHETTASAAELPYAARIQRVDGEVAYCNGLPNSDENENWVAATPNQPFSVGDRIYTRENSRASLAFSGRNFARLDSNTALDVVALADRRTQLALRDGSAIFDVGYLQSSEIFEVATPNGAVDFVEPGLYNVGFDRNGGVLVSVLSGLAQVVGLGGSGQISKGEMLTLVGQTAAQAVLSHLNGQDAGYVVDDYYRYQYPNYYDGRYQSYDAYLSDPFYYDPYRRSVSYKYVSSNIPGIYDLDNYGDWQDIDGYGYAWRPRVETSWVPYQQGYWTNEYPYGPTWVSTETWGYAPYHYGRWANVSNQWYWIPDGVNTTPTYAPALVAFIPLTGANEIGWVPLAPGEVYVPRYYDADWQPRYLSRADVVTAQLINLAIPGSVTVVPIDAFGRVIDPHSLHRIDQQRLASLRPTLDPLTLTPLRNAVFHSAWGRGKIDLPPGIAKKLHDTPVFFASDIKEPRFRKDLAKAMHLEKVPDKARNEKFKMRDDRAAKDAKDAREFRPDARQVDQGREQEIKRLSAEAVRGNKEAERQARQLEQQQRKQARAQEKQQPQAQPHGERVANPAKPEFKGPPVRVKPVPKPREQPRPAQPKAQPQPHGERVGNPAKPQAQPKHDAQAAPKHERHPLPPVPAAPADGGKGKGKEKPKGH